MIPKDLKAVVYWYCGEKRTGDNKIKINKHTSFMGCVFVVHSKEVVEVFLVIGL